MYAQFNDATTSDVLLLTHKGEVGEVRMPDALEVALSIYRPAIALKVFHRFGRSLKHKYYPSKEGGLSRCTT